LLLFTDPPDGYASVSMVDADYLGFGQHSDDAPLSDLEKEGLLRAPYMPFDGMNEYGLAVGMMAVPHAEGGDDLRKTTLGDLQVIRLLLDYARTVDEAIGLLKEYNVDFSGGPPVHYLVADRSGAAAVVEYLDGQPHVIRNTQPWLVATNFLLAEEKPVGDSSSCWRYNHVFSTLQTAGGELSSVEALSLLQDVSQGGDFPTIWSVVYNMSDGTIQAVIRKDYGLINIFQLEAAR
jgi:predicted choloylglycine hydrolase